MHDLFWFAVLALAVLVSARGVLMDTGALVRIRVRVQAKRLEKSGPKPYDPPIDPGPNCWCRVREHQTDRTEDSE